MIGDVVIGGVFLPGLLVLALLALCLTGILARFLALAGAYRLFAYRPLLDLAIFVIIYGLLIQSAPEGLSL